MLVEGVEFIVGDKNGLPVKKPEIQVLQGGLWFANDLTGSIDDPIKLCFVPHSEVSVPDGDVKGEYALNKTFVSSLKHPFAHSKAAQLPQEIQSL